jgi:hypothetical protein
MLGVQTPCSAIAQYVGMGSYTVERSIMWCTFKYQKNNRDAYLVNVHGDHAELIKVNPEKGCSEHIMLTAPVAVIRQSVKRLIEHGYKKCDRIELSLRGLASN